MATKAGKREKLTQITTPAGRAGYTYLDNPDTKWKDDGEYRTEITLEPGAEAAALVQQIDEENQAALDEAEEDNLDLHTPYEELEDGSIKIKAKMLAGGTRNDGTEWTQEPVVFDSKGKPIRPTPKIGPGSLLKLAIRLKPFVSPEQKRGKKMMPGLAGVSIKLAAVQLLELVEYGANASAFGFGEEEGFEQAAAADTEREDADEDDDGEEEADF